MAEGDVFSIMSCDLMGRSHWGVAHCFRRRDPAGFPVPAGLTGVVTRSGISGRRRRGARQAGSEQSH
jgi:hypothetical protein